MGSLSGTTRRSLALGLPFLGVGVVVLWLLRWKLNLLPLPALDGGRLLFFLIELVRRKPISPKYESWVHAAGFVLLMLLMVLVTFQDIVKLVTGG